jgi:beta-lactamase regulating signal transducer with metallopeptidase domain/peptidoglycan hydrolase CwlO-like protein
MSELLAMAPALAGRLLFASVAGGALAGVVWAVCRAMPSLPGAVRRWLWWGASLVMVLGLLPLPAVRLPVLSPELAAAAARFAALAPGGGLAAQRPTTVPQISDPQGTSSSSSSTVSQRDSAVAGAASSVGHGGAAGLALADPSRERWRRGAPPPATVVREAAAGPGVTASSASPQLWLLGALVCLWAAGALLRLGHAVADLVHLRRLIADAAPAVDPELVARFRRLRAEIGVGDVLLRLSAAVETPQVAGVFRPVVILPAHSRLAADELEMTLAHELVHVRHRDLLLGLLPALAERLLFFHPLARLAAREHSLAFEAACDAAVLERLAPSPRAYGRLLLKLSLVPSSPLPAAVAVVTQRTLHRRLQMLLSSPRPARSHWGWLALPAAVALLLPIRLTAAPTAAERDERPVGPRPWVARAVQPTAAVEPVVAPRVAAVPVRAAVEPTGPVTSLEPRIAAGAPEGAWAPRPALAPAAAVPAMLAMAAPAAAPAAAAQPAPAPRRGRTTGYSYTFDSDGDSWVYLRDGDSAMSGNWGDRERALRLRGGDEPILWVSRDGVEWVITDPALLARIDASMEPQRELGRRQAELGERQAELGSEQAELGERQARLGAEQAALGESQARLGAEQAARAAELAHLAAREAELAYRRRAASEDERRELERQRAALEESRRRAQDDMRRLDDAMRGLGAQQGELGARQGELGASQGELGSRQGALGSQQGELGSRQAELSRQLQRTLDALVDDAIRSGKAERVQRR